MKIFKSAQIREADAFTIANEPVSSIELMERAASGLVSEIIKLYQYDTIFIIFCGPGNNGGDGLALARLLTEKKYSVEVFIPKISNRFSDDFTINFNRLKQFKNIEIFEISDKNSFPKFQKNTVIIDALFGSGLTRPLSGFSCEIVDFLNNSGCEIVSVDIPSGLSGEENFEENKTVIKAAYTLTFEFPFLSFFLPENEDFIGDFKIIPIGIHPEFIKKTETEYFYIEKDEIQSKLKKRKKFSHKGNYGHGLLLAGSYGKAGACTLATRSCLRTGIGLLTAHVPKCNYQIQQITNPEAMLTIDAEENFIAELPDLSKYNAAAIGPGIGFSKKTKFLLKDLILNFKHPIVFDADAITILGENKNWLAEIPENSVFTPHPKEFERLVGTSENNFQRNRMQIEFSKKYKCFVVLKGAYSSISTPDGKCFFNSAGNPGMAKGGSGDVLTGMILAMLAQNYLPEDAVLLSVYFHGLAGDLAAEKLGQISMTSADLCDFISKAFTKTLIN
jgi:NAD(P)H-hydrate epimerase